MPIIAKAALSTLILALPLLLLQGCAAVHVSADANPELAVVRIGTFSGGGAAQVHARGFFVTADGLIVTCGHALDGAREVLVLSANASPLRGQILQNDKQADLAIVQVRGRDFPWLRLAGEDAVPPAHVRIAGAGGITHAMFKEWGEMGRDIVLSAPFAPDDAGSPLVDDNGQVIGVVRGPNPINPAESLATPAWKANRMLPHPGPAN